MYVDRIKLQQFRCFEDEEVSFIHPKQPNSAQLKNINLLLGDNGSGKTSILRGVALAVLSRIILNSGLLIENLVRRRPGKNEALSSLWGKLTLSPLDHPTETETETGAGLFRKGDVEQLFAHSAVKEDNDLWAGIFDNNSPSFLIVGYGASRWVPNTESEIHTRFFGRKLRTRYERVASLFEAHTGLVPLGSWLPELKGKSARFEEIFNLINDLLPDDARVLAETEGIHFLFEQDGTTVPFPALSDGYRAYIGWIGDLLYHLWCICPKKTKLVELEGLVLIDEVDLHLHPQWQRTVLPVISKYLPRLQFILSSHSPIVAGTLQAENLIFLNTQAEGPRLQRLTEEIHGLNADQILLSAYFNLESTRAGDVFQDLNALARKVAEGDQEAARAYMDILAGGQRA